MKWVIGTLIAGAGGIGVLALLVRASDWGYRGEAFKHWEYWCCLVFLLLIGRGFALLVSDE